MAFVEAMAIEVSRATVPDRPLAPGAVPADDLRGSPRAVRLGQAGRPLRHGAGRPRERRSSAPDGTPSSGFGVFDSALAAGGRVKAIVAPGMAGVTRREIDELTERARRFGAKGLAYLALEPGGDVRGPIAKFLSDDVQRAIIEQSVAAEGDLILIVADSADVTADVLGRLRVELGDRLGLADPDVLSYVWIDRFPMYQWDAEIGRWHATHNPFTGRPARGRGPAGHRVRRPGPAVAGRPGRPCPGAPVRPRAQRLGARRRLDPDPPARAARAQLPAPGPLAGGDAREVRGRPRRVRLRRAAARRDRARHRSLGGAARRSRRTSAR